MRALKIILSLFTAVFALCGCSQSDVLNLIIPDKGYSIHKDIAYGPQLSQALDIYVPDKPDADKTVVVFYYGGAWQKGDKDIYKFLGQALTSKGYTVVVPAYRQYPEVYFPIFMEDAAVSFIWAHAHITEYGGNPQRMFLMGHSAGGHIAALMTFDQHYLKSAGGETKWIKGLIGMAGPYDFLPMTDPKIIALFSKAKSEGDTQPINFVRKNTPPMLILTAEKDDEVGAKNGRNLAEKLREYGDSVEEKEYPGIGHIGIMLSMAYGFRSKAPTLEDVDAFIQKTGR